MLEFYLSFIEFIKSVQHYLKIATNASIIG